MASVSHPHPNNSNLNSTDFMGFSNSEISHVPADVWEIFVRDDSATMKVNDEVTFDTLENLVCEKYGAPHNMVNNGRIYRGFEASDGVCNNTRVILTFYKSTHFIRIPRSRICSVDKHRQARKQIFHFFIFEQKPCQSKGLPLNAGTFCFPVLVILHKQNG